MKTLVVGLGNPILSDDGIGTIIVNDLRKKLDHTLFDFATENISSLEIINLIQGYENLIVIDGKMTSNGIPGDITIFSVTDYYGLSHLDNYHDVSFRDMIKLGKSLNLEIPERIQIIAVEIAEDKLFSKNLSPVLRSKYNEILQEAELIVTQIAVY